MRKTPSELLKLPQNAYLKMKNGVISFSFKLMADKDFLLPHRFYFLNIWNQLARKRGRNYGRPNLRFCARGGSQEFLAEPGHTICIPCDTKTSFTENAMSVINREIVSYGLGPNGDCSSILLLWEMCTHTLIVFTTFPKTVQQWEIYKIKNNFDTEYFWISEPAEFVITFH